MTAPVSDDEPFRPVDQNVAPLFSQLHAQLVTDTEQIVDRGLGALLHFDMFTEVSEERSSET
ncbi:MAG: hypothetical protein ACTIC1_09215 [Brevibacterium sp.]